MKTAKRLAILALAAAIAGCETKAGTGAVVGGAGGAAVGGLIGSNSHARAGEGALIGGAIGALGGGLIGHSMDKQDKEQARKENEYQQQTYQEPSTTSTRQRPYTTASPSSVTQTQVIEWSRTGVKEDLIIDRIQRSGQTFTVTAADEKQMRDAGVTPSVINAMKTNR
jgi:hypothetical protein